MSRFYRATIEHWIEFAADTDEEAMQIATTIDFQYGIAADNGGGNSELVFSTIDLEEVPLEPADDGCLADPIRSVGFDPDIIDPLVTELFRKLSNIEQARRVRRRAQI